MRTFFALVLSGGLALSSSCTQPAESFTCANDAQCSLNGAAGACEPTTHACSFLDSTCPSGRRYGQYAGSGLGETCICGGPGQPCCTSGAECQLGTLTCSSGICISCLSSISVRAKHSCVRTIKGSAYCWGENDEGQLGAGNTDPTTAPVRVRGLGGAPMTGIAEIVAGAGHSCARMTDGGTVWCWGKNDDGQTGNGTFTTNCGKNCPAVQVLTGKGSGPLTGATKLAAGFNHTCALKDGALQCWGLNLAGQLGDGTTNPSAVALVVNQSPGGGALGVLAEAAAGMSHTCARMDDGNVYCWGDNLSGQLGNGSAGEAAGAQWPTAVHLEKKGVGIVQVAAGEDHTCARKDNGPLYCWGEDKYGQVGDNSTDAKPTPTSVLSFSGSVFLSTGEDGTCAVKGDGSLWCWGNNGNGQLGDGTVENQRNVPTAVLDADGQPLSQVTQVGMGESHTCALKNDGTVWCWGLNSVGQLGVPAATLGISTKPIQVPLTCE